LVVRGSRRLAPGWVPGPGGEAWAIEAVRGVRRRVIAWQ
jgi:hypothetical protein